jgi:hypothetical protein
VEEIREDSIPTLAEIKNGYEKFVEKPTADDFSSLVTASTLADEWQVIDNNMSKSTVDGTNLLKIENAYDELYNRYGFLNAAVKVIVEEGTKREETKDKTIDQWKLIVEMQHTENEKQRTENKDFLAKMGDSLRGQKRQIEALDIKIADQDLQIKQKDEHIKTQDKRDIENNENIKELLSGIKKLNETLKDKDEKIVNLESEMNQLILENEQSDKTIVELQKNGSFEENQKLHGEIITLKQDIAFAKEEIVGGDRWQLRKQIEALTEENNELKEDIATLRAAPLPVRQLPVTSTKHVVQGAAIGIKSDRWKGFKHTINWVDDIEVNDHNKKILERNLKILADLGNNVEVTNLLRANRDIVNGRAEPDSLHSTIFRYEDKTPLMLAAKNGHADCVQTLINYDADVNYLDRHNKTALDYAHKFWKKHKNSDVREPLWANGALPSSCCEISESTGTPSPYTGTPTK